jgi:hypothetical protein
MTIGSGNDDCNSDIMLCFYMCLPLNTGLITLGHYTARLIVIVVAQE